VTTPGWLARFLAKLESGAATSLVARADGRICGEATCIATCTVEPARGRDQAQRGRDRRERPWLRVGRRVVKLAIDMGLEKMVAQLVESQAAARKTFEASWASAKRPSSPARWPTFAVPSATAHLLQRCLALWSAMEALVEEDYRPHEGQ